MLERARSAVPPRALFPAALLGFGSSVLVVVASPPLVGGAVRWWFAPGLGAWARPLLYAGMVGLAAAWLLVGRRASSQQVSLPGLVSIGALWTAPLLLGPPLFSHDLYSYLAQGTIAHHGLSPYEHPPTVLRHLGQGVTLAAVDPFWRHTTAPYGPLFIALVGLVVGVAGSNLVLGGELVKLIDAVGLVLLIVYLPRLARRVGGSPARAVWLVALNPLLLLALVAPGHNDLLMVGVMAVGVELALARHPLWGTAVCALAATIKVPALAGVAFVAVAWMRASPDLRTRARALAAVSLVGAGTLAIVTVLSGLGPGWVSSSVFSTPNRVHLAITPATALGWTSAWLLHAADVHVGAHALERAFGLAALALAGGLAVDRLRRVARLSLPYHLGPALLAFAVGGPAAWPWYLSWGLVLVAACPPARLGTALVAASLVGAFVVKPDGILALPIQSSPAVLVAYIGCAAFLWRGRARTSRMVHVAT